MYILFLELGGHFERKSVSLLCRSSEIGWPCRWSLIESPVEEPHCRFPQPFLAQ